MNFENQNILAEQGNKWVLDRAFLLAKNNVKERINPEVFRGLYGDKVIDDDSREVEEMEIKFNLKNEADREENPEFFDKNKQYAEIFEYIFSNLDQYDWFGENVNIIRASRLDDLKGVDNIIEFSENGDSAKRAYTGVAIDNTLSLHPQKKIESLRASIRKGDMSTVKYFVSSDENFRGELKNIPKIIVGADSDTIHELARCILKDKKALAKHPFQFDMLLAMIEQSEILGLYANSIGETDVARAYISRRNMFSEIYDAKISALSHEENEILGKQMGKDKVLTQIRLELEKIKKEYEEN